jgi:hypothetical protein
MRFSDHALFPEIIRELELRHPLTNTIGDIAIIDALNAIQERNLTARTVDQPSPYGSYGTLFVHTTA